MCIYTELVLITYLSTSPHITTVISFFVHTLSSSYWTNDCRLLLARPLLYVSLCSALPPPPYPPRRPLSHRFSLLFILLPSILSHLSPNYPPACLLFHVTTMDMKPVFGHEADTKPQTAAQFDYSNYPYASPADFLRAPTTVATYNYPYGSMSNASGYAAQQFMYQQAGSSPEGMLIVYPSHSPLIVDCRTCHD